MSDPLSKMLGGATKRKPIIPPPSRPKARLKALRQQQQRRWNRPGVGTDRHGEPY